MIVQEATVHNFLFSTSSIIPGTKESDGIISSNMLPAFHIFFPLAFKKDANNLMTDAAAIATSQTLEGNPAFTIDDTLTYNELCQLYLCYLITFDSPTNIPAESMRVSISNLFNPDSVALTGDITITTLMKYTTDPIYYKIDTYTGDSGFRAEIGTIDGAKIIVTSLTNDLSTSASNQVYQLEYTSTHRIPVGGFIKINVPKTFSFSSESSTIAQFSVIGGAISYCSAFEVDPVNMEIIGITNIEMPANTVYKIRMAGL